MVKMKMNYRTLSLTVFGIIILGLVQAVYAKAIAGNIDRSYVAPQPDKTLDAGFAAAYLGLPQKGHHTQEYINGYINGTCTASTSIIRTPFNYIKWLALFLSPPTYPPVSCRIVY